MPSDSRTKSPTPSTERLHTTHSCYHSEQDCCGSSSSAHLQRSAAARDSSRPALLPCSRWLPRSATGCASHSTTYCGLASATLAFSSCLTCELGQCQTDSHLNARR